MILVERTFTKSGQTNSETVGIVFLSDLMFILRQINFHEILTQPVIKFVMNLNGNEEDRKIFKSKLESNDENLSENNSNFISSNYRGQEEKSDSGDKEELSDHEEMGESFFASKPKPKKKSIKRKDSIRAEQNFKFDDKELQIDHLFGHIFGIERVHILKKTDRLQDVIEKIAIVPEHKLVYVEDIDGSFSVLNILT